MLPTSQIAAISRHLADISSPERIAFMSFPTRARRVRSRLPLAMTYPTSRDVTLLCSSAPTTQVGIVAGQIEPNPTTLFDDSALHFPTPLSNLVVLEALEQCSGGCVLRQRRDYACFP